MLRSASLLSSSSPATALLRRTTPTVLFLRGHVVRDAARERPLSHLARFRPHRALDAVARTLRRAIVGPPPHRPNDGVLSRLVRRTFSTPPSPRHHRPHRARSWNAFALAPSLRTASPSQTRGFASQKHKRVVKAAKGYRGRANRCFRIAIRRVEKALQYAYRDRRVKRRERRKLWIQRLNAGVRQHGTSYSRFVDALRRSDVALDRKVLAEMASHEPFSFKAVLDVVRLRAGGGASS